MNHYNFLPPRKQFEGCLKLFFILILTSNFIDAQTFTRVNTGDIISDQRGSRGSAWGDYDGDGNVDLFLTDIDTVNYLYRNNGNGTFSKTISGAIASDLGLSNSASWGDFDNDGDLDLFVAIRDVDRLFYRNNGNNTFTRITSGTLVTDNTDARGVSWVDYDNDGNLDLFIANIAESNQLYRNNGNSTFTAVTSGPVVTDNGRSSGGIWGDIDSDGDLDLFVPNDGNGSNENNFLYENNGDGTFSSVTSGPVVNNGGDSESALWADFDNDGDLDLFVANDGPDGDAINFLYQNNGSGSFSRAPEIDLLGNDTEDCSVADYDNDGDLDIFIANNNSQNNGLYRNDGNLNFTAVSGINVVSDAGESEGSSWADYDNDGDLDLFVANDEETNFLYRNNGNSNRWIKVNLVGTVSNSTAIGARIRIRTTQGGGQPLWQIREISGQTSAKSQNDITAHFGLGSSLTVDSIFVDWPSGLSSQLAGINSNQRITIEEGVTILPPAPPQNLGATALSISSIRLDWQANNDAPRTYFIYRSLSSGSGYVLVDSAAHPLTTYQDNSLGILTTYYYRISAVNNGGESGFSNEATATTNGVAPSVPTGLLATATSSSQIDLSWNASLNLPEKYYVYRSTTSGSGFVLHDSVDAAITNYSDIGLPTLTQYFYKMSAANVWGESGQSGEALATTNGLPPGIPPGLNATTQSDSRIALSWTAATNLPQRYVIYRSLTPGSGFAPLDSITQNTFSYIDSNLTALTTYYYTIQAVNIWGRSALSPEVNATTFGLAPSVPNGLTVAQVLTDSITISWGAALNNPTDYRVFRSLVPGGVYTLLDSTLAPTQSYSDTNVVPLTTYYYRVSARNIWGESLASDSVSATPPPAGAPTPPQALAGTPISETQIDLNWTASSGTPIRYRIYRSLTELEAFVVIDSVDHPTTAFSNIGLNASTTYYYQVRAVNSIGESAPSNTSGATTFGPPLPASNLQITSVGSDSIGLAWSTSGDGNPQYYRIYRAPSSGGSFVKVDSVLHPLASYTDRGLLPATAYFYQIDASNNFGGSAISNQVNETTNGVAPNAPTALQTSVLSPTQAALTWTASVGTPQKYYLYRSLVSAESYTLLDSVDHPAIAYNDNTLEPETRYYYVVSAGNIWGESGFSNEDSVDTPGLIPTRPLGLLAQGISASQIDLNWKAVRGAERYRLFRSLTPGAGFALIDSVSAPDSSFSDINLDASTTYYYQITAQNIWGESPPSDEVNATTGNIGAPAAPQELSATPISTSELRIEWVASISGDPVRYRIYRSLTSGTGFVKIDSINHPQTIYVSAELNPSTPYYYRVSAVNAGGESPASAEATATTFGAPTVPAGLTATALSSSQIDLGWEVSSGQPTRYRIFRALSSGGPFTAIDSLDHPQTAYSDTALTEFTTYYYQISALNQWGTSLPSIEVNATTPGSGTPTAPTDLIAGTVSNTQVLLSWATSSGNPLRYRIYRSLLPQSGFVLIDSTVHPVAGYVNSGLTPSTTYFYQIAAVNLSGESPQSNTASGTTFGPPTQPLNPDANPLSTSEIDLSWAASNGNPTRYRIYRSLNSGAGFTQIDSISHPSTGFRDEQLSEETTYYYFVTAFNQWGESIASQEINATTEGSGIVTAPSIITSSIITNPLTPQEGNPITVQVQVNGTSPSVTLHYGVDNDLLTASNISMISSGDDTYTATLPGSASTAKGLWFRIQAENSAGVVTAPIEGGVYDVNIRITNFSTIISDGGYPDGLPANGWNSVALPFNSTETISLTGLFGNQQFNDNGEPTNWAAYTYANNALQSVNSIRAGRAYFVYHKSDTEKQLTSSSGQSNDVDVFNSTILQPGWNLIPWPFNFASDIIIDAPQVIGSIWTSRSNSWSRLTDQLAPTTIISQAKPYQALAIFNKNSQDVLLGDAITLGNEIAPKGKTGSFLDWSIQLSLNSPIGMDEYNIIGMAAEANEAFDFLDEEEPLAVGNIDNLFLTQAERTLSSDIRPLNREGAVWEFKAQSSSKQHTELSFVSKDLPNGWQVRLIDVTLNETIDLADIPTAAIPLKNTGENRYYLIVGNASYIARKTGEIAAALPKQFALHQNYPNPFNGSTQISFDLPKSGDVRLAVYNLLGQQVTEVIRGYFETGSHVVTWDGNSSRGIPVASGLYFIRFEAESYSKVIKAMLVK
ncbi:MAG: fibronectin type III domain-containing protein [Calditrichia bacterium]